MRPPPPITTAQVLHEGRACLAAYPMSRQVRAVLTVLALASVPALLLATLTLSGIDLPRAAATALAAQAVLALASAADRAGFHRWSLTGSLYRWSRQAGAKGGVDALSLLVDSANAACRKLWGLNILAAGVWLGAALVLYSAPRFVVATPYWMGCLIIATSGSALVAAVHRAELAIDALVRDPIVKLSI